MPKRLTEKAVDRLGIKQKPYVIWDAAQTGLGMKITPHGRRIWCLQLRFPGHKVQTTRTLGLYPNLGLADARKKAGQWYGWAKQGIDPRDVESAEQAKADAARQTEARKKGNTFTSVAEQYISERSSNRRAEADAREIRRMLIAAWRERPIHEITPRDVRELITKLRERVPYDARNAWTHTVGIFKHAVHNELIEASPCASLDKRLLFKGAKIGPRQRTLNETEIIAFWRATEQLGYPYGPAYQLLLLTGCRLNEVLRARWSEIHPELRSLIREARENGRAVDWVAVPNSAKIWTIPAARFKSDAQHIVPLSDDTAAIFETLPQFAGCDFVFTSAGEVPIHGLAHKIKQCLDERMLGTLRAMARQHGDDPAQVNLAPWVNHDLRRVVRTNLSALNIPDHVAEMALGHGRKGIQRVYDQHKYLAQIREALERWAAKVSEIVKPTRRGSAPSKVIATTRRETN